MHSAPSVSYPVGRSAFAARACWRRCGCWALAAALAWSLQAAVAGLAAGAGLRLVLACAAPGAGVALAALAGRRTCAGTATAWQLGSEGAACGARPPRARPSTCSRACCCAGSRDAGRALAVAGARVGAVRTGTRCAVRYIRAPAPPRAASGPSRPRPNHDQDASRRPPPSPGDTDLMLVERTVAGDQKAFELLVHQVPAPHRAPDRPHGARRRPGRGHRAGNLHPRLPGAGPVPRRGPVLHLAVPDCRQHRQESPGRPQARPAGLRERPARRRRRG